MHGWYIEKRKAIEKTFETAERLDDQTKTVMSPSGIYSLEVSEYRTGPNTWPYSRGVVRRMTDGRLVADVKRNHSPFRYSWCENHSSRHHYLICGEDYQGQTVIELDTARRVDHIPDEAEQGFGFCWAAHYPSPDGKLLFVDGCIWAAPYELILFDFSEPMTLPYREIKRWPLWECDGFQPDGSFRFRYYVLARRSDGKPLDEMPEVERDELEESDDYKKLCGEKWTQVTWRPNGSEEVVELGFRDEH